ncbi:MAG: tetratricopeptide repeat protein, partial [Muribaculaceae bacterium]|nr:tetratricopeptide repeat protein [Muribaculaceae bacterium]
MKHLITLFISFSFILANAQSLDEKADQAYSDGDFQQALELYQQAAADNGVSSMLYYNMGNAYYRLDSIAKAIGCYERALRLDPKNDDARANIKFINERYNLAAPEKSAPTIFVENITDSLHPNSWAIMSLILFIILLLDIALYL